MLLYLLGVFAVSMGLHALLFLGLQTMCKADPRVEEAGSREKLHQRAELHSRVVSTLNAVLSLVAGVYCYFIDDQGAFNDGYLAAFGHSEMRNVALMVLAGYLFYGELEAVERERKEGREERG